MFGLGKKASKGGEGAAPEAKLSKPSRASEGKFSPKDFLLMHGEKFAVAIVVALAGYFMFSGYNTKTIDPSKTTDDLVTMASSARNEVAQNHWEAIAPSRPKESNFRLQSELSRSETQAAPYRTDVFEGGVRSRGGKRGDPELLAPVNLQTEAFMGAIAANSTQKAMIDSLPAALPVGEKRGRRTREEDTTTAIERMMAEGYDFGYQPDKSATQQTDTTGLALDNAKTIVPQYATFASVTAAVPHEKLVENYNAEFESAPDYNPNRDTPNYLGFEVQRVDVTTITDLSTLTDADWQTLPDVAPEEYAKRVEKWPGTADETANETYVSEKLTMKIPPILISRYDRLVDNPKVPQINKRPQAASGGGYGGGANYGSGYGQSSEPNYGAGYGAGASYGAGYGGGAGSNYGGNAAVPEEDLSEQSKAETASEFKLLRFFDFNVQPGHIYVYRVRVVLEDPNYPRSKTLQPKTSTMKPETVQRVQDLQMADEKRLAADKKAKRTSRLETKWSEPSPPVTIPSRSRLFASKVDKRMQQFKHASGADVNIIGSLASNVVYGEWDPKLATFVPSFSDRFGVGTVFGGDTGNESFIDVIDPISKKVKEVQGYRYANTVTVTDISGGDRLVDSPPKNDLASGGQIVAFDSASGELIVSREFDDYTQFRLFSYADEKEAKEDKDAESGGSSTPSSAGGGGKQ